MAIIPIHAHTYDRRYRWAGRHDGITKWGGAPGENSVGIAVSNHSA